MIIFNVPNLVLRPNCLKSLQSGVCLHVIVYISVVLNHISVGADQRKQSYHSWITGEVSIYILLRKKYKIIDNQRHICPLSFLFLSFLGITTPLLDFFSNASFLSYSSRRVVKSNENSIQRDIYWSKYDTMQVKAKINLMVFMSSDKDQLFLHS